MLEKVTIAIDGDAASDAAVAWVIDRARHVEMMLDITAIVALDIELPQGRDAAAQKPYEHALLRARADIIAAHPGLTVMTSVRHGIVHDEIVAASRRSDLLVLGSNRPSAWAGLVNGTVPLRVAGRAACITVVVPVTWAPSVGEVVAGWADDGTGDRVLQFAAREASRRSAGLTVVHAWSAAAAGAMVPSTPATLVQQIVSTQRDLLTEAASTVSREHPELTVTHLLHAGAPADAIIEAASQACLVVIGSRGRGAIASLVLGSVSHGVLMHLPTVVAIVPHQDETEQISG